MASEAERVISALEAEVEQQKRLAALAVADQRALSREFDERIKAAVKPFGDNEKALWWLLAQIKKDPKPLRHDDDCWLRHARCFAEKLRRDGGPLSVARELSDRIRSESA